MTTTGRAAPYDARLAGQRLRPSVLGTRYHALKQLARALADVAAGLEVPPGALLVDYGCGSAPYEPLFRDRFERYVRADLPGNPVADVVLGPRGELPLDSGTADVVLSTQVLVHVDDPRAYLGEARRVLKPGGALVLSTHGLWRYTPEPADRWRWTRDGLELELRRAGFEPVVVRGVLGRVSAAVQLLQDAVADRLPRALRPLPGLLLQRVIGVVELGRADAGHDAAIYVVVARRTG